MIDADEDQPGDGQVYRDCEMCLGSGYVGYDCGQCRRTGKRRAQLVLTVVNRDTGVVRSANVVPGGVEPRRNVGGRWELALSPILAALAGEVGAVECRAAYGTDNVGNFSILLPTAWSPDLPAAERQRLEGEAIARHCWHPWRLYYAHSTPMLAPTRDLAAELASLCHLADLLCLDLVVEARRGDRGGLRWDIRYEIPGSEVPAENRGWPDDLSKAVAVSSVDDAMFDLVKRSATAPAHYLRSPYCAEPSDSLVVDLDQLERRIYADLDGLGGQAPGAQAIWRDGKWQHTRLQPAETIEVLATQSTGQVVRHTVTLLDRAWEPPAPGWLGDPIPYGPCPDCDPAHRLRPCLCTLGNQPPDPNCPGCSGAGAAPTAGRCSTCRDTHRVYHGTVVTLTDLDQSTMHLNWYATDQPVDAPQVATQPGGKPVCQLPVGYQLRHWAQFIGARPADLSYLDGGHHVGQDLREGVVTVDPNRGTPLAQYIADANRGQPAGRLLINAAPPATVPVLELIRLALGLHLTLLLTLEDHSQNESDARWIHGEGWNIEMIAPERAVDSNLWPCQPTVEAAAAYFLEYLENTVYNAVPADPRQGIPVPQTPQPAPPVEDPVPLIRRLAQHHAGNPVSIRYHHTGCQLYVHESDGLRHLVSARTATIALTALGLGLGKP
ncbi:hypothetical protein ACWDV4_22360 [Micromonospora sp. NPDC003197]